MTRNEVCWIGDLLTSRSYLDELYLRHWPTLPFQVSRENRHRISLYKSTWKAVSTCKIDFCADLVSFRISVQKKHTCLSVPLFDPRPNTWAIQSILVKIRDFSWIIPPGFEWIHEMPLNQAVFHRIAPQVSLHTSGSNTGSVVGKLWIGDTGDTSIIFRLNMDEVTPFKQLVISGYIPLLISNQSTSKPHIWSLESLQPWFNHHWTITEP